MKRYLFAITVALSTALLFSACSPGIDQKNYTRSNPFDPGTETEKANTNVSSISISTVSNVIDIQADSATLSWQRNVDDNFYAYVLYGSSTTTNIFTNEHIAFVIYDPTVTTMVATNLPAFTTYYVGMRVYNKAGYFAQSEVCQFRTQPDNGGTISIKGSVDTEIYGISAAEGFLFFGMKGSPSWWGGYGEGISQNMVRAFYLPAWFAGYEIGQGDNLVLEYTAPGATPADYTEEGQLYYTNHANPHLAGGVGDVFMANNLIYFSARQSGALYVMATNASDAAETYFTRKTNYWESTFDTAAIDGYWEPETVYGTNLRVETGIPFPVLRYKVYYTASGDAELFALDLDGTVYELSYVDETNLSATEVLRNTNAEVGDTVSIAADGTHAFVLEQAANRFVTYNLSNEQFIATNGGTGTRFGKFNTPSDIAVYDGTLFVADTLNHRVQIFLTNGTFISSIGSYGRGNDQFDMPRNLFIASNEFEGEWLTYLLVSDNVSVKLFDINNLY